MEKIPFRIEIELRHDETGITFEKVMAKFGYYLKEDPRLGMMCSPTEIPLPVELQQAAHAIFDFVADTACKTEGTIPLKDAKKIKSVEVIERQLAVVEAAHPKDIQIPQPLQEIVAKRTIEILAQKAANHPHIQEQAKALMTNPFLKDEEAPLPKVSWFDKLKKYLPWALLF